MKPIWINLKLYFNMYEISNFFGFFLHFSELKTVLFDKNNILFSRMWRGGIWHIQSHD